MRALIFHGPGDVRLEDVPRPEPRPGDVRHSRADASAAARDLGFRTRVGLAEGLERTVDWLRSL